VVLAGARSGKDSRIAAPIVTYEALFGRHEAQLAKGERGTIALVAQDLRASRIAYTYIKDYLTRSALLAGRVAEVLASGDHAHERARDPVFSVHAAVTPWAGRFRLP
jgi:hypothetical protein